MPFGCPPGFFPGRGPQGATRRLAVEPGTKAHFWQTRPVLEKIKSGLPQAARSLHGIFTLKASQLGETMNGRPGFRHINAKSIDAI
jgi:hypothetical protein